MPRESETWRELRDGAERQFCYLSVDVVDHSGLCKRHSKKRVDDVLQKLRSLCARICSRHRGKEFQWQGDGGLFWFFESHLCDDAVISGETLLRELPDLNRSACRPVLEEDIELRVVVDVGLSTYHADHGNVRSRELNFLKKHERELGLAGHLTITDAVYREIAPAAKRHFVESPSGPLKIIEEDGAEHLVRYWRQKIEERLLPAWRPGSAREHIGLDFVPDKVRAAYSPELVVNLVSSLWQAVIAGEPTRQLFEGIVEVLSEAAMDGEDLRPALEAIDVFARHSQAVLEVCKDLPTLDQFTRLRPALRRVVVIPLLDVFGDRCRVRIWVANGNQYTGLLALNMREAFRVDFEAGRQLHTSEAPYEQIAGCECLVLRHDAVKAHLGNRNDESAQQAVKWYEQKLGLGSVIDETYTWHFPPVGSEDLSRGGRLREPSEGLRWALSFDLGQQNAPCDRVLLKMFDRLFGTVGKQLPMKLEVLASESRRAVHSKTPDAHGPNSAETTRSLSGERVSSSARQDVGALKALFAAPFDCVPSVYAEAGERAWPRIWVYSRGDPAGVKVARWIDKTRKSRGHGVALLVGPSGTGKGMLVRSLLGEGGRPGEYNRWDVGDDPRQALLDLLGGAKDFYPSSPARKSVVEAAGEGIVHVDEFLSAFAAQPGFDLLKGPVEDIKEGRVVQSLPAGEGRRWTPKALMVFVGVPEHYAVIEKKFKDWVRRFADRLSVPGWLSLTPETRAVVLRWCLQQEMAQGAYTRALVHADAFHWLVVEPRPTAFFDTNMSGIRNIINYAGGLGAGSAGELRLSLEHVCDYVRDAVPGELLMEEVGPGPDEWLELGDGPEWRSALSERELFVTRMAQRQMGIDGVPATESKEALWAAVRDIDSAEAVYDLAYLMCAAKRFKPVEKIGSDDPDPCRTACNRYQDDFENKSPWLDVVKRYLPAVESRHATPADLKIRGASKGALAANFEQHVRANARRIQEIVARIACVHPAFTHVVPYWNWPHLMTAA